VKWKKSENRYKTLSKLLGNLSTGQIFVISAPSGTGKTTLVDRLIAEFPCVTRSISCTTRPPRPGEVDGKDYFFLTKVAFDAKVAAGDFLEYAEVFGHSYGTSKAFVEREQAKGHHVILIIDTQGAKQLKGKIDATFIFITPPSLAHLQERLGKRQTESRDMMTQRLTWARYEIEQVAEYDYQIVNDSLDIAYTVLKSILIAEEHRRKSDVKNP
jgi:guanylate kinase